MPLCWGLKGSMPLRTAFSAWSALRGFLEQAPKRNHSIPCLCRSYLLNPKQEHFQLLTVSVLHQKKVNLWNYSRQKMVKLLYKACCSPLNSDFSGTWLSHSTHEVGDNILQVIHIIRGSYLKNFRTQQNWQRNSQINVINIYLIKLYT